MEEVAKLSSGETLGEGDYIGAADFRARVAELVEEVPPVRVRDRIFEVRLVEVPSGEARTRETLCRFDLIPVGEVSLVSGPEDEATPEPEAPPEPEVENSEPEAPPEP